MLKGSQGYQGIRETQLVITVLAGRGLSVEHQDKRHNFKIGKTPWINLAKTREDARNSEAAPVS